MQYMYILEPALCLLGRAASKAWWRKHFVSVIFSLHTLNLTEALIVQQVTPRSWVVTGFWAIPDWLDRFDSMMVAVFTAFVIFLWFFANEYSLHGYRSAKASLPIHPNLLMKHMVACCLINGAILYLIITSIRILNVIARFHGPSACPSYSEAYLLFTFGIVMSVFQSKTSFIQPVFGILIAVVCGYLCATLAALV